MAIRARTLLAASIVAIPCLVYTGPAFGHNGRDGAPPPLQVWLLARAPAKQAPTPSQVGKFVDIYQGIVVKVDPKTGVRSYVQVGDVAANPARARSAVPAGFGPGPDFWVNKEFERNPPAPADASYAYQEPPAQVSSYDDGYYGGYYPAYGYGYGYGGGYGGRPGGGHDGGGRPGHGGGGGDHPPPRTSGIIPQPYRPSPPPGPYGGGVGSPPPYNDPGVGAPPPLRYNGFRRG